MLFLLETCLPKIQNLGLETLHFGLLGGFRGKNKIQRTHDVISSVGNMQLSVVKLQLPPFPPTCSTHDAAVLRISLLAGLTVAVVELVHCASVSKCRLNWLLLCHHSSQYYEFTKMPQMYWLVVTLCKIKGPCVWFSLFIVIVLYIACMLY